jgi:hypothetical protein
LFLIHETYKIPPLMTVFYSLAAVIELCASALAEDDPAWRRKAYVWRKLGKVLPDGAPNTRGSGASKRYAEWAIPLIGVMLLISNRFGSVELLDEISRAIQRSLTHNRGFSQCWAAALATAETQHNKESADEEETQEADRTETDGEKTDEVAASETSWLTIAFPGPARVELIARCGTAPRPITGEDVDIYSLDLSYVFEMLLDIGLVQFGEGFRLTTVPRASRRS